MTEITAEVVQAAAEALSSHKWSERSWAAHRSHKFDSGCAVCQGDVSAIAGVVLAAIAEQPVQPSGTIQGASESGGGISGRSDDPKAVASLSAPHDTIDWQALAHTRDLELAAVRRQLLATKMEKKALGDEASAVRSDRDRARASHKMQQRNTLAFLTRVEEAEARLARFRTFLDEDFRQWCSPEGIAATYATRLLGILDQDLS